ncbi:hypothetical protein ACIFOT_08505 [Neobacillus sp. NRS-1170]|uniref:hypothetical protein n=1 Tax=Neobacillus sp. NRS-1170 TaxID=3233898 RepID=UPI003D2D9D88
MLIGAEGTRLLQEYGTGETPQALKRRGGSPNRPKVREVPGAEINIAIEYIVEVEYFREFIKF